MESSGDTSSVRSLQALAYNDDLQAYDDDDNNDDACLSDGDVNGGRNEGEGDGDDERRGADEMAGDTAETKQMQMMKRRAKAAKAAKSPAAPTPVKWTTSQR